MKFNRLNNISRDKIAKIPCGWLLKTYDVVKTSDPDGSTTGYLETVATTVINDPDHKMCWAEN